MMNDECRASYVSAFIIHHSSFIIHHLIGGQPMFCPQCATQNADDAKYCRSCGTDISLVSQAVTGHLAERLAVEDESRLSRRQRRRRRRGRDEGPPSIEHAVKRFFMGMAFIFVAFSARTWAPAGRIWWFWMFIPAAVMLADGVSTYLRIAEDRKKLAAPPLYAPAPPVIAPPQRVSALPTRNTGEILPPPSITEGTTRHLNVPVARRPEDV
jgi:hypothetical protein